jgi:crotonobetainyl-CoA:carnitine CoA-transferase CaiB-like acyl-CoA transferase
VGHPELAQDRRFADIGARVENSDFVLAWLAGEISRHTTAEWLAIFKRESIAAMPVNTVENLFQDPHLTATGFFEAVQHPTEGPLKIARVPFGYGRGIGPSRPAPRLGEHTREVLLESGCSPGFVEELLRSSGSA